MQEERDQDGPMKNTFVSSYQQTLRLFLAKDDDLKTDYHAYLTLALVCREQLIDRWLETQKRYSEENVKRVCYLSMEFLMGRYLQNTVLNVAEMGPLSSDRTIREYAKEMWDIPLT